MRKLNDLDGFQLKEKKPLRKKFSSSADRYTETEGDKNDELLCRFNIKHSKDNTDNIYKIH